MENVQTLPAEVPVTPQILTNQVEFSWNYDEVKANLTARTEKYTNLVVTDENLKDSQKAKRELTSMRTALNRFRKAVKGKLEEPAIRFDNQIKELTTIITTQEAGLSVQLEKYEADRVEKLKQDIRGEYEKKASAMGLDAARFDIAEKMEPGWLNKTQKWKDTCNAIDALIRAEVAEQKAEEQRQAAIQAKADLLYQYVQGLNKVFDLASPVSLIGISDEDLATMPTDELKQRLRKQVQDEKTKEDMIVSRRKEEEKPAAPAPAPQTMKKADTGRVFRLELTAHNDEEVEVIDRAVPWLKRYGLTVSMQEVK